MGKGRPSTGRPIGLPKYSSVGVERTISPAETARWITPLMERIGVTRVGEVTHLDRCGLPNFLAVRPRDLGPGISYYNGKGATRTQARVSAMMEAIERYSGERCDLPVVTASYAELLGRGQEAIDPAELLVPRLLEWSPDLELEWTRGFDMLSGRPVLVPLNSVVCPYYPENAAAPFFSTSNGLASGNTLDEAVCHALCEVNERDAQALYESAGLLRREIGSILSGLGVRPAPGPADEPPHPLIEHAGLPARPARVLRRLIAAGLRIYLRQITSDTGIPSVSCVAVEPLADGTFAASGGMGSHPDAGVALLRALTEAAQTRLAKIQGGREDLPECAGHSGGPKDPDAAFGRGPRATFASTARGSHAHRTVSEDVAWLVERFRASGFPHVVAVDLTRPELNVPVVRMVVPRAESWPLHLQHSGRAWLSAPGSRPRPRHIRPIMK